MWGLADVGAPSSSSLNRADWSPSKSSPVHLWNNYRVFELKSALVTKMWMYLWMRDPSNSSVQSWETFSYFSTNSSLEFTNSKYCSRFSGEKNHINILINGMQIGPKWPTRSFLILSEILLSVRCLNCSSRCLGSSKNPSQTFATDVVLLLK